MKRLDSAQLFETATPPDHLARDSARGGVLVIATQGGQFLLQLISITVLARTLTPEDYGLVAMVAVVINFATMFCGKPELTDITTALAIAILLNGISIQHQALLQRHMRFDA